MGVKSKSIDPLLAGFFSTVDAARLVGTHPNSVRGWLNGYRNSTAGPVIDRDFEGSSTVSFLDLMELRFVAFFRAQGVAMPTIRRASNEARKDWGVQHPLALSRDKYVTDRRIIFAKSAGEEGDEVTWDMASGQHEMWDAIEQTIEKGIEFDPKTHLASLWHPKYAAFPDVIVDPRIAFGRSVVKGTKVPTAVLFRQFRADKSKKRVAKWFEVSEKTVATAVAYEIETA